MVNVLKTIPAGTPGSDPDGMIDNHPGVAHPSRPLMQGKPLVVRHQGDDYARHRLFGSDVVQQASESSKGKRSPVQSPIASGVGARSPNRLKGSKKKKKQRVPLYPMDSEWDDCEDEDVFIGNS